MAETRQRKLGWAEEDTGWPRRDKGSWVGQEKTLDGRDETKEAWLGRRRHGMAETRQRKLGWAEEDTRWPRRDKGSWVGQKKTLDGRDETKEAGLVPLQ
jgi:hypothetical protein